MPDIPTSAPHTATAGDSLTWYQRAGEYTPADGWALSVEIVGRELSVTATTDNGQHRVTLTTAQTQGLGAGAWSWVARVSRAGERVTVDRGTLTLAPDPLGEQATATTSDEDMLAAIRALMRGRATSDLSSYSVAGRSLTKMTLDELIAAESYFEKKVLAQRNGTSMGRIAWALR